MPSFGTIFSPFWKTNVSGGLVGLNFNTSKLNILKALLDSISYRLYDNIRDQRFSKIVRIVVDGGMTVNEEFMQCQANLFNKEIEVRSLDTCWGVAKGVLTSFQIETPETKFENIRYIPNSEEHIKEKNRYERWAAKRQQFYGWQWLFLLIVINNSNENQFLELKTLPRSSQGERSNVLIMG